MYGHPDDARWKVPVEENVLSQVENLRTYPAVAVGPATGVLKLHARVYKMETGEVCSHDPESGRYLPLAPSAGSALPSPFRYGPIGRTTDPAAAARLVQGQLWNRGFCEFRRSGRVFEARQRSSGNVGPRRLGPTYQNVPSWVSSWQNHSYRSA